MRHVRLGRTGLPVPGLCLDPTTFGRPMSMAIRERAAAGRITFLDASDVYPLGGSLETVGRTEEMLGRGLGPRREFVIGTVPPRDNLLVQPIERELYRRGDDSR